MSKIVFHKSGIILILTNKIPLKAIGRICGIYGAATASASSSEQSLATKKSAPKRRGFQYSIKFMPMRGGKD